MCACRQKKSFLIADILGETKKKPYKNLSNEPSKPLICSTKAPELAYSVESEPTRNYKYYDKIDIHKIVDIDSSPVDTKFAPADTKSTPVYAKSTPVDIKSTPVDIKSTPVDIKSTTVDIKSTPVDTKSTPVNSKLEDNLTRFNVISEVQNEIELSKVNLEHRRNTFPLHPTPVKPNYPWNYRGKDGMGYMEPRMNYYSEQMLNSSQLLRSQLAANRFVTHPFAIRQSYGFDRVAPNCCAPWWGLGGRRKGGQVRFTSAQTGALERRFNASKYLSPDERRALATTLRLSDRQVKTWFQNRRAKWRRTTPESADAGSPPTSADGSDDEVQIADDDSVL